jgi:choline-sulfatase
MSDHGEMLGDLGLWTKCTMNEGSVRVPLIAKGPGFAEGRTVDVPVSLVDVFPTIVETAGLRRSETATGQSLASIADTPDNDRSIISQYHDWPSTTGVTMLRWLNWKYVFYVGGPPQLFDLSNDPYELHDLAANPAYAEVRAACDERLRQHVDPEAVSSAAFGDQAIRIEQLGGRNRLLEMEELPYTPMKLGEQP